MLYFADAKWWGWHKDRPAFQAFVAGPAEICTIQATGDEVEDGRVHMLRNAGPDGLSTDPEALATGRNSGYQAMNIALLAGVKTILLLGYDGQRSADGRSHWFGEHPVREPDAAYQAYRRSFKHGAPLFAKAGVRVINCSPGSAIKEFEQMEIEAALAAV